MAIDVSAFQIAEPQVAGQLATGFGNPMGGEPIIGKQRKTTGYSYYRKADGWIRLEQNDDMSRLMFAVNSDEDGFGWSHLGKYGMWQPKNVGWDIQHDQYRGILEMGGAAEFPIDQLIELGWHRKPPVYLGLTVGAAALRGQPVRFPQLEALNPKDLEDVTCRCGAKMRPEKYGGMGDLQSHELIMHKEASREQSLARALASEFHKAPPATDGMNDALKDKLLEMALHMEAQDAELRRLREQLGDGLMKAGPAGTETPVEIPGMGGEHAKTEAAPEKEKHPHGK